jgi:hypothetical protein
MVPLPALFVVCEGDGLTFLDVDWNGFHAQPLQRISCIPAGEEAERCVGIMEAYGFLYP